ncbi:putative Mg2+ transporter-C (MgtC) family protein [Cyclonatronum proteinivorum]|uniref:Protein MgtC n=1 Tax=Cyclonatronum proteinivorum TaxID=1457365 RepID=A0A345UN91_9BACT|nr:MgtC/SapB family protein [Cyclonatronum proteinivorum]AXJ01943.1 putative Mg2+ transporter-C (MgtC) family protein [Cyclonatronum proteinivorum]
MELLEFTIRVGAAFILGSLIGVERQIRQRMAGLRTNALVAVGAALFVSLGMMTPDEVSPTRVAAQVVSGIGFLGAGVIFKEGLNVSGLNTAATIWGSGAIGVLAGSGFLTEATVGTALIILAHTLLRPVAHKLDELPHYFRSATTEYTLTAVIEEKDEILIRDIIIRQLKSIQNATLNALKTEDIPNASLIQVEAKIHVKGTHELIIENIAERLSKEPTVSSVDWEVESTFGE